MKTRWLELSVGLFMLVGLACLAYLSINLGDVQLFGRSGYVVYAEFASVAGLKKHAAVTMAGVPIGEVEDIRLVDGQAMVTLRLEPAVKLEEDVIASVKTKGIIGDKYISISPGGADEIIPAGGKIRETQPPLDIEELVAKFVFGNVEK